MEIKDYLEFLKKAKLNFLAIKALKEKLDNAGFTELKEEDRWDLKPGDKRYVIKSGTSVMAFIQGRTPNEGFSIVGSHSDSPGFRIKPSPDMEKAGVAVINTEVYGGPILSTWFDRPLSIGGKLTVETDDPLNPELIYYTSDKGILFIPSVAIHMNREVNKGVEINPQENTLPVLSSDPNFKLIPYIEKQIGKKILSHELYLINDMDPELVGVNREYYMSGRLDNLSCAYANIDAIINARESSRTRVAYVSDNEEIGSMTMQGAFSPFLRDNLVRIVEAAGGDYQDYRQAIAKSVMISSDQAHAVHPNYTHFADPTNRPKINEGPVIKVAANGTYTSDARSIGVFKAVAEKIGVPVQTFVNRSDKRGGSTIAAITTSKLDMPIVDVGNPMWGMHSAVETAGVKDHIYLTLIMTEFLSQ